jgi:hypothetical protein
MDGSKRALRRRWHKGAAVAAGDDNAQRKEMTVNFICAR